MLLLWFLKVNRVQAAPLPGADGFTPIYNICRNRQTYSREATALSTRLKQNPNNQNIPRENGAVYDRPLPSTRRFYPGRFTSLKKIQACTGFWSSRES